MTGRRRRIRRWIALLGTVLVVPLVAGATTGSRRAASPAAPTQVDVTRDLTHRYGEAEVAVNPKNPKNLVYFAMSQHWTYACQQSGDPTCQTSANPAPAGYLTVPGFIDAKLFVSFDRGRTWKESTFPGAPVDHPDLLSKSDPMVTTTPNGTFYIAWDDLHMTTEDLLTTGGVRNGGVAVSRSTDGGRTWSTPVLTGTPEDRAWLVTDRSTGRIYLASGLPSLFGIKDGLLGPRSSGDAAAASGPVNDRWLVSSKDGVHWTQPQRFGGGGVPGVAAGTSSMSSAAHGVFAATFASKDDAECRFLLQVAAPCTGLQTTRDSGATWSRHQVPVPADATGFAMVAADPAHRGRFAVAVLDDSSTHLLVYRTNDTGASWRGPTSITDDAETAKFKPWLAYSPNGVLGVMWRSFTQPGASGENEAATSSAPNQGAPYAIWAAISRDGGASFSKPLEISTKPSPAADPKQKTGGDDFSFINLDGKSAFVAWADWRPGEMSGYFSAVDLAAFSKH